jgi:hypothetical protein
MTIAMHAEPQNLRTSSLIELRAYLLGVSDLATSNVLPTPELYRAIDDGLVLNLLSARLGPRIERVWLPLGSFEDVEFHACLRCLKFHAQGREEQYVSNAQDGLKLLSAFIRLTIDYLDLGKLDELLSTTISAIEAGSRMLFEEDRWYLSNVLFPFPGARCPKVRPPAQVA